MVVAIGNQASLNYTNLYLNSTGGTPLNIRGLKSDGSGGVTTPNGDRLVLLGNYYVKSPPPSVSSEDPPILIANGPPARLKIPYALTVPGSRLLYGNGELPPDRIWVGVEGMGQGILVPVWDRSTGLPGLGFLTQHHVGKDGKVKLDQEPYIVRDSNGKPIVDTDKAKERVQDWIRQGGWVSGLWPLPAQIPESHKPDRQNPLGRVVIPPVQPAGGFEHVPSPKPVPSPEPAQKPVPSPEPVSSPNPVSPPSSRGTISTEEAMLKLQNTYGLSERLAKNIVGFLFEREEINYKIPLEKFQKLTEFIESHPDLPRGGAPEKVREDFGRWVNLDGEGLASLFPTNTYKEGIGAQIFVPGSQLAGRLGGEILFTPLLQHTFVTEKLNREVEFQRSIFLKSTGAVAPFTSVVSQLSRAQFLIEQEKDDPGKVPEWVKNGDYDVVWVNQKGGVFTVEPRGKYPTQESVLALQKKGGSRTQLFYPAKLDTELGELVSRNGQTVMGLINRGINPYTYALLGNGAGLFETGGVNSQSLKTNTANYFLEHCKDQPNLQKWVENVHRYSNEVYNLLPSGPNRRNNPTVSAQPFTLRDYEKISQDWSDELSDMAKRAPGGQGKLYQQLLLKYEELRASHPVEEVGRGNYFPVVEAQVQIIRTAYLIKAIYEKRIKEPSSLTPEEKEILNNLDSYKDAPWLLLRIPQEGESFTPGNTLRIRGESGIGDISLLDLDPVYKAGVEDYAQNPYQYNSERGNLIYLIRGYKAYSLEDVSGIPSETTIAIRRLLL